MSMAKHLFSCAEELGVKVNLNVSDQNAAMNDTDRFIKKFSDFHQAVIVHSIAVTTRNLLRPKDINEEIIQRVIQSNYVTEYEEGEYEKMWRMLWEKAAKKEDEDETMLGEEEEDDDDDDDEETMLGEESLEDLDDFDTGSKEDRLAEKAKNAEPTEEDRTELLKHCKKMGCSMKPGQDQKILHKMIPFLSHSGFFPLFSSNTADRSECIELFMQEVLDYIDSSCLSDLNDLGTVQRAIETVKSRQEDDF